MSTDNPPLYIPFGDMAPDLGMIDAAEAAGSHVLMALNVWPLGQAGYAPAGDLVAAGHAQTPAGQPTGSGLYNQRYLYYGNTEGEIWEADYSALTIVKRHTLVTGSVEWDLVRFGDSMIATNYVDPILVQTARAASFANLINAGAAAPINAQDETDYAVFAGGTGHAGSDVITLNDGTTVTVDTVAAGVVTEFTIANAASSSASVLIKTGETLTQTSTDGSGIDFSLTLAATNIIGTLQAKHVETFRERIILGNLKTTRTTALGIAGNYPYTLWWSGKQAANNFDPTDAAFRSGYITLPTQWGEITGLSEVGDVLLVFLERGVYRMTPVDGITPFTFSFKPVVEGVGTIHRRSTVSYGGAAYFWGPAGPAIVSASGYAEIALDKLASTLKSGRWPTGVGLELDRTQDTPDIIGCLSPSNNSIIWRYPPADSAYNDALLVYNYVTGRFSIIVFRKNTADPTIDNTIRLLEDRSDVYSETWEVGKTLALGSFGGSIDVPVDAQTETSYDGSPATEGTFSGGTGHADGDVITLSDGSTVTIPGLGEGEDSGVSAGVVIAFTVDSSASLGTGVSAGSSLTQSSTTGSGINFSLTLQADNITTASDPTPKTTLKTFSADEQGGENGTSAFVGPPRFQLASREILKDTNTAMNHLQLIASPSSGASGLPALSVTVTSKKNPLSAHADDGLKTTTVTTADSAFDESGWMSLESDVSGSAVTPQDARFHQFDLTVTPSGTWSAVEYQGIQIRYTEGGKW